ncbi:hypothetical protein [Chenggangzhangella methanolivorans]|uniref:Uncharacterized protein n=1 Tax=Chenggangzhangella methanolivorans TaxID=1437009 RepID=A0A9E6UMC6_9HYPH|nr:hypothetical protein [Chenggangzhangella methanolivorans]QZN99058.1 hypothetical protein K6K41_19665 [Chenggangzhangella methanolivorans]
MSIKTASRAPRRVLRTLAATALLAAGAGAATGQTVIQNVEPRPDPWIVNGCAIGLPPEKWSSLMYGFWPCGGLNDAEEGTHLKRSSRSCGRSRF